MFFATTAILFLTLMLPGCSGSPLGKREENTAQTTQQIVSPTEQTAALIASEVEAEVQIQPTLDIAIVDDHSLSFKGEVEQISDELLSPVNRYFNQRAGSEQVLFSMVQANSNVLLSRFVSVAHKVDTSTAVVQKNSWISSGQPRQKYTVKDVNKAIDDLNNCNWQKFSAEVIGRTSGELAKKSDVANAIDRALLGLSEQPNAQKYLIVATDFLDDYNRQFAQIPCDVKLLIVGANIAAPLDKMFGTSNYRRFESLSGAINFITRN